MSAGIFKIPVPQNERILSYAPGTSERRSLKEAIDKLGSVRIEIPLTVGGEEVETGSHGECRCPHDHQRLMATYTIADEPAVEKAIEVALEARTRWASMPWHDRAAVFLRAAELMAGPHRDLINASTMLCQSKNVFQAEIDTCEMIDFLRFNAHFMQKIYEQQPLSSSGTWNRMEYRPLEGFVFAVTPFNFTSIAGNLPSAPAMMGNVALWKPSSAAVYSNHFVREVFEEAGLPEGVITMLPSPGSAIGKIVFGHPMFSGLHFTGSTEAFSSMWVSISENFSRYRSLPRIVGETGGKGFIFAHLSADLDELCTAIIRGAFEYQGQKCSAASRAYIPESIWPQVLERLKYCLESVRMGSPDDFTNFVNAVIDRNAFYKIRGYIEHAKNSEEYEVVCGGECDESRGFFIEPTIVVTVNSRSTMMREEIFGPVMTIYVYPDDEYDKTLKECEAASTYALTGSIFAKDRGAISAATNVLVNAAGNFYVNDKPTGAVVGQQPFGGGRSSGTNDKAGSLLNLLRWVSPRTIKENFSPPKDYRYPFMLEE